MSILVGGISLFNLTRKAFDVGLNGVLIDIVSYYQNIFYPFIEYINIHIDWLIPEWDKDIIMLIVFIVAINSRSFAQHSMQSMVSSNESSKIGIKHYFSSIKLGVITVLLFFSGSNKTIKERPASVLLATSSATVASFIFLLTLALFIPYLRVLTSFLAILSAVIFLAHVFRLVESNMSFTNKKIFSTHYIGAIIGMLVFFSLNLYAPAA